MIKIPCPYCETVHNVKKIKRIENIIFKERLVEYEAIHFECCKCHECFDSAEMMDKNLLSAREAYEAKYESVSPQRIVSIREKYNASQKAFGLILGMGELTINSYESGKSIPDSTNRLLLQLAEQPLIFSEMYSRNKNKIGKLQRERIESSAAYNNCCKWGGLEKLYNSLSESERINIEGKTYIEGDNVSQIVVDMVKAEINKPSFDIYNDSHEIVSSTNEINIDLGVA